MQKKVLVVDDSEAILEVVKIALEMDGLEVSTCQTGACFRHLEHTPPDLILLDGLLSGEDGSEMCRRLKRSQHTRHIPVILLSAQAGLWETAERCGANDALAKPFRLTDLRGIVKKHLSLPTTTRP